MAVVKRKDNTRLDASVHVVVPLRDISGEAKGIWAPESEVEPAELLVTDFTSTDQAVGLAGQLDSSLDALQREGIRHVILKAYPGDIPEGGELQVASQFDFACDGVDSERRKYRGYHRLFDRGSYGKVVDLLGQVGPEKAGQVMAAFKGNIDGLMSYIAGHKDASTVLNISEVGGNGDPYRVVRKAKSKPSGKCICDPEDRIEKTIRLYVGYNTKPKGGLGLTHITSRRMGVIRDVYMAEGVSEEEATGRFVNAVFSAVRKPGMIIPNYSSRNFYAEVKGEGREPKFMCVVVGKGKKNPIVTAYLDRNSEELRIGLKSTISRGVPAGERGRYLEYVNRYLQGKGIRELTPAMFGL